MSKFIMVYGDTSMALGHDSLRLRMKIDNVRLKDGEFCCFINKAKSALKLMTNRNILVHLKMPMGEYLDLDTIKYIPLVFKGETLEIDYKKALTWVTREKINKRR